MIVSSPRADWGCIITSPRVVVKPSRYAIIAETLGLWRIQSARSPGRFQRIALHINKSLLHWFSKVDLRGWHKIFDGLIMIIVFCKINRLVLNDVIKAQYCTLSWWFKVSVARGAIFTKFNVLLCNLMFTNLIVYKCCAPFKNYIFFCLLLYFLRLNYTNIRLISNADYPMTNHQVEFIINNQFW